MLLRLGLLLPILYRSISKEENKGNFSVVPIYDVWLGLYLPSIDLSRYPTLVHCCCGAIGLQKPPWSNNGEIPQAAQSQ